MTEELRAPTQSTAYFLFHRRRTGRPLTHKWETCIEISRFQLNAVSRPGPRATNLAIKRNAQSLLTFNNLHALTPSQEPLEFGSPIEFEAGDILEICLTIAGRELCREALDLFGSRPLPIIARKEAPATDAD